MDNIMNSIFAGIFGGLVVLFGEMVWVYRVPEPIAFKIVIAVAIYAFGVASGFGLVRLFSKYSKKKLFN